MGTGERLCCDRHPSIGKPRRCCKQILFYVARTPPAAMVRGLRISGGMRIEPLNRFSGAEWRL